MQPARRWSLLVRHSAAACLFAVAASVCGSGIGGPLAAEFRDDGPATIKFEPDPAQVEFFEKSVRPILATRCQGCHGPDKQKGGLRLDARTTILTGGSTGPAIVPGKPDESLLVDAINYGEANHMPPKSKLPPEEIATLTEWVKRGAPWGIDNSSKLKTSGTETGSKLPGAISKEEFQARARHWSFQPLRPVPVPELKHTGALWARNAIDGFINASLNQNGLTPAPEAGKRTLIRRLSFDLTGLPPAPAEVAAFLADRAPEAYERLVDRLLASPHYGERWARHWLDLVRYAETAGHEFDYDIPNAFRYRDYVIRALNIDLPYNQFVTEQVAGDLMETPRKHPALGFNESILGCGFYFLGEGTHSPVDIREEEMRRIDNQLDVLSKTFLGLTLACARCHDHKFDPITHRDYYAMAGFLHSSRHQLGFMDPPGRTAQDLSQMRELKASFADALNQAFEYLPESQQNHVVSIQRTPSALSAKPPVAEQVARTETEWVFEDFNRDHFNGWQVTGDAFGNGPTRPGDFRLDLSEPKAALIPNPPGVAHSGLRSNRLQGVLRSRTFTIEAPYIHLLAAGRGGRLNVVIDGFEKIRAPIYGGLTVEPNSGDDLRWITVDVGMWLGHLAYLEIADGAVVDYSGPETAVLDGRGWIAVDEIRFSSRPGPTPGTEQVASKTASGQFDLNAIMGAIRAARAPLAAKLGSILDQMRAIDSRIPDPTFALSIADGTGIDERIHIRGSHRNLGDVVPRRFLEALGGSDSSAHEGGSGRDELARRMVDPAFNPLVPRVLVNRLWKHHFGDGIVRSPDDFGAMGQKPSHPELLDWLAGEFVRSGWSIKAMQRLIVTSSTYRMSSVPSEVADRVDPSNRFLHRMNVRRLEAESIRDLILAVSGDYNHTMYGPGVRVHLTGFMEGRGRPSQSGPLDGGGRRSLYLNVRRNFLNPMLLAFDAPAPFSTMGRRNVSNVPAQALTLMNDPLVTGQARLWAENELAKPAQSTQERLDRLYQTALGRLQTDLEKRASLAFLSAAGVDTAKDAAESDRPRAAAAWADLCHVLFNMKEFIFVD
jgi:Protein of unknown function (DUF1553)/Protein of unknown function (DUF1549)/Planctomycete cytochrome C